LAPRGKAVLERVQYAVVDLSRIDREVVSVDDEGAAGIADAEAGCVLGVDCEDAEAAVDGGEDSVADVDAEDIAPVVEVKEG
jgi:hypothetical protein